MSDQLQKKEDASGCSGDTFKNGCRQKQTYDELNIADNIDFVNDIGGNDE